MKVKRLFRLFLIKTIIFIFNFLFSFFLLYYNFYYPQQLAQIKGKQNSPQKSQKKGNSPEKSKLLFKPQTQIFPDQPTKPKEPRRLTADDPITNNLTEPYSDNPLVTSNIPIIEVNVSDDEQSNLSQSITTSNIAKMKEQKLLQEDNTLLFSASSLQPLSQAIQEKYDVEFNESFPQFIDATLEANSTPYLKTIQHAKEMLEEVSSLSDEAVEKSQQLLAKSDSIETKADIALGQIQRTKEEVKLVHDSRLNVSAYIIFFILFFMQFVYKILEILFNFIINAFRVHIPSPADDIEKNERKNKDDSGEAI